MNCKQRIGSDDFISSIRKTLTDKYTDKIVGLGGVFLLKNGKAKQHVMQDFSKVPIHTDEDLNEWLKFYEMNSTLIAVGTLGMFRNFFFMVILVGLFFTFVGVL